VSEASDLPNTLSHNIRKNYIHKFSP